VAPNTLTKLLVVLQVASFVRVMMKPSSDEAFVSYS